MTNAEQQIATSVLVIGTGGSGLRAAIDLAERGIGWRARRGLPERKGAHAARSRRRYRLISVLSRSSVRSYVSLFACSCELIALVCELHPGDKHPSFGIVVVLDVDVGNLLHRMIE